MLFRYPAGAVVEALRRAAFEVALDDCAEAPTPGIVRGAEHVNEAVPPADGGGRHLGEFRFARPVFDPAVALRRQDDPGIAQRRRRPELALHHIAQRFDDDAGIAGKAMVEPDRSIGLFPAVAVVEAETGRQGVPAAFAEIFLVDDQHAGFRLRFPDMGIESAGPFRPRGIEQEWVDQNDQRLVRDDEIVDQPHGPGIDEAGLRQPARAVDMVKHKGGPRQQGAADVPQRPVRIGLWMRGEGNAAELRAPGLEALGRKRLFVEPHGRAAFPQGQQFPAMMQDGDVLRVHAVRPADRGLVFQVRGVAAEKPPAGRVLAGELRRADDAPAMGDPAAVDGEFLDHAVAVEPVPVAPAEPVVDRRPVAEKAAFQPGGPCAANGERARIQPVRWRFPAEQHWVLPQGGGKGFAPVIAPVIT